MNKSALMERAIHLALKGSFTTKENPNVGCLIYKNGMIISEGWHVSPGSNHAEVNAILNAESKYRESTKQVLEGSSLFVTLEPCSTEKKTPPCTNLIQKYPFKEIIYMQSDPSQNGSDILKEKGFGVEKLNLKHSVLNNGFFKHLAEGNPFVRAKIACSMDGKIAFKKNNEQWITTQESRKDGYFYRAISGAIITGSGTIDVDDPLLNVRLEEALKNENFKQPLKALLSSKSQIDNNKKFFQDNSKKIIFTTNKNVRMHATETQNVEIVEVESDANQISILSVLSFLGSINIKDVLLEAGPRLISSFINLNLIDEYIFYIAPKVLGNKANSFYTNKNLEGILNSPDLEIIEEKSIGKDLKLVLRKKNVS